MRSINLARLRREDGVVVGDWIAFEEADDPVVTAAAFELVQVLARTGITAGGINITFSGSNHVPDGAMVTIALPSLTDPAETESQFHGLQGVFAIFCEEKEAMND